MNKFLIKKLDDRAIISCQNPIDLSHYFDNSEPEPDITIARFKADYYSNAHPTEKDVHVLIEVSDTTLDKDRTTKCTLYAQANIPEYWIINLIDQQIEIHRKPKNGEYHFKQIISQKEIFNCETIDLELNYTDLFKIY